VPSLLQIASRGQRSVWHRGVPYPQLEGTSSLAALARVRIVTLFLRLKQSAEYLGPASLEVAVSLESALQHILDPLLLVAQASEMALKL
jgi:hypothetical protein